jgi:putative ABC transport system substrate-binding protein
MRRREFIIGGAVASAMPLAARAQQAGMPVVGVLSGTTREPRLIDAVLQGLNESGYAPGRNVTMEYRFAEGQFDRLPGMAEDLARHKAAVIVAMQSVTAPLAAKALTPAVPVVFSIGGDPVKLGLVSSFNRPGGNVTGATFLVNTLSAKRLELLHNLLPHAKVMGLLVNPKNPAAASETSDVEAAARALGIQLHVRNGGSEPEIDAAFADFAAQRAAAVTFAADATFNARRAQLIALAARHALPTMYFYREFANDGGLISYGGYDTDAYRQAGVYAGRILKGEKPAALPVQQVTKVELVINLKTAKALGVDVPLSLLGRADDVIE